MTWILILLFIYNSDIDNLKRQTYITDHKDLAIVEMHRKGIPASIKLAQAILESGSGTSTFARSTNNHFGIKCKTYWKGNTFYHNDDDYDDNGELIKSCFRSYDRVIESYVDHSNFLSERSHYAALFFLSREDYKGWAFGLQKYGYATDKQYAQKLISIIEKEELYVFDQL